MKVAIDVSPLIQTRAGTARYLKALLAELRKRDDVDVTTLSFGRADKLSTLGRDAAWYPFVLGRSRGADLLHCPTYRGPARPRLPLVVTVHDLAVFRHPEAFNRWTRTYSPRVVPHVLAAASRIIAVSEFTKRELTELLDVPADKIRVVPNGVDEHFTRDGPAAEGEYVLTVGTLEPRKNLARIAAAVDGELRVVGARGWGGVEPPGGAVWLNCIGLSHRRRRSSVLARTSSAALRMADQATISITPSGRLKLARSMRVSTSAKPASTRPTTCVACISSVMYSTVPAPAIIRACASCHASVAASTDLPLPGRPQM